MNGMFTKKEAHNTRQWRKALEDYRRVDQELTHAIEAGIGESQLTRLREQWQQARAHWEMWENRMAETDS